MKLRLLIVLCVFLIVHLEALEAKDDCRVECNETEYKTYVDCIRKRIKRSTDCDNAVETTCEDCEDSCLQCDCSYCSVNACQESCVSCCPNNPPCTTNRCCHKTCHARCKSFTCRSECRKTCTENINGKGGGSGSNVTIAEKSRHNITTVINLHNIINNTNIIDIPVQVNNTNINNITLSGSEGSLTETVNISSTQTEKETCCYIVSPRQCVPTDKYPYVRCFHYRRRVCGSICRAPIMHEQPHEVCDQTSGGTSCHPQIIYIPQPQPRCLYQSTWPYVSCGIPQQQFCGGCYQHYNYVYAQLPPPGCSPACYDDGYGAGPYYRQGPFYRPGYAHVPSCYQIGACGPFGYGGGFGSIGYAPAGFGGFGGFGGFPAVGYPPNTYENNMHIETDPSNVIPRRKEYFGNRTNSKEEKEQNKSDEVPEPLPSSYYPVPMIPPYSAVGYPYFPQIYPYNLPPEVDIQATIVHPEKESRYAQITITKDSQKREIKDMIENDTKTTDSTVDVTNSE